MSGNASSVVRTRKNVLKLGNPGDDLDWYGKAVADLQNRPVTDPTSWRYQAAVHGYLRAIDPNPTNVPFPSSADQRDFWNQCQHQTWYFLPWHRAYLACFEQIVAASVVKLGGPPGWALPYWNYSDPTNNNQARLLPAAFVRAALSNNGPNPLFVQGRNSTTANFHIPDQDVSLHCLTFTHFTGGSIGVHPGFGGPQTTFSHGGADKWRFGGCTAQPDPRRYRRAYGRPPPGRHRSDLLVASREYRQALGGVVSNVP